MKQADRTFPLPFFTINKNFTILTFSQEAEKLCGTPASLLEVFEDGSLEKVKKWVTPELHKAALEVHLKPVAEEVEPLTVDLYVTWDNDLYAQALIIPKDDKLTKVTKTLNQLRGRLNDTNFELLDEKEKLENAISQNNRLSAPFIRLTEDTALIPLFGELTQEKMQAVEDNLFKSSQNDDIDRMLFDFTAVGEMNREGIRVLTNMMTSLFYMGAEIVIIGVKPKQVKVLHEMVIPSQIRFMNSLQQAIHKYCVE
ncbi:STAS domain-containing protein [Halobacillus sp. A1]|uniref:STAS domain-containing protein n=1 Tax=Halobacillus sp. A1 TaxID=2880262 RepID=UPI0020A6C42E|nr:STAS domain-containing protein [Halobacillus sp. A1]MCP3031310.1 STAS domain-containing protein [Halobacillus sp. A1]